ncbi:MAG: RdgB/HAM1 family non-canonical purine NTP pyrophosphatase [Planctomycetes bacterium]|nr:RdgB/HAM1 family non-canonical purine NTP pyrophosphatase [Planctomycetota bacterium]
MKPFRLLIGSNNPKKRKELGEILVGLEIELLMPADLGRFPEPEENGKSFEENARIKALYYAGQTDLPTLADDSGLVVDALAGLPGIYSSRYAGVECSDLENCEKLLAALADVPDKARTARFVCSIVVVNQKKVIGVSEGFCEGTILREMRGRGGFGYDPLFFFASEGKTFAELSGPTKNRISHRAQALQGIRPVLKKLIEKAADSKNDLSAKGDIP